jgi:hypothetical protein
MFRFRVQCTGLSVQRPNSWTKYGQKSLGFSSLLFTVISTALAWDFYFFKLMQPLTYFFKLAQPLRVSVKEKGGKPYRTPHPLPYGLRNPYRNLLYENSQEIMPRNLNEIARSWILLLGLCRWLSGCPGTMTMTTFCPIIRRWLHPSSITRTPPWNLWFVPRCDPLTPH